VQRAFKVVVVELQAEGLQVEVLLAAQVGHGKVANVVEAVDVAGGGHLHPVGAGDRGTGLEIAGDVGDVVAPVAVGREIGGIGLDAARAGLHTDGQVVDLVAG